MFYGPVGVGVRLLKETQQKNLPQHATRFRQWWGASDCKSFEAQDLAIHVPGTRRRNRRNNVQQNTTKRNIMQQDATERNTVQHDATVVQELSMR